MIHDGFYSTALFCIYTLFFPRDVNALGVWDYHLMALFLLALMWACLLYVIAQPTWIYLYS